MTLENTDRNKKMVLLRYADPKTFTINKLATGEGVTKQAIHRNLIRDWHKYLTKAQLRKRPHPFKSTPIHKNIFDRSTHKEYTKVR